MVNQGKCKIECTQDNVNSILMKNYCNICDNADDILNCKKVVKYMDDTFF